VTSHHITMSDAVFMSYTEWLVGIYHEHPYHVAFEAFLVALSIYILVFKKTYDPKKKGFGSRPPEKLTDAEIDELLEDWEPEPLLAEVSPDEPLTSRTELVIEEQLGPMARVKGIKSKVVNLASFDMLGLSVDKSVKAAAIKVLDSHGCGSCGPRGFYGTFDSHLNLEKAISGFYGTASTIVYSDTVATSASVVPAFAKRGDLIVCDEGICGPLLVGLRLSRAKVKYFKHNDMADLERVLKSVAAEYKVQKRSLTSQKRFILVEGLYRDYGDFANLKKVIELKKKYFYRVMVDDTYGCFACGEKGRGVLDIHGVSSDEVDLFVGSMATTLASVGGFCTGTYEVVNHQRLSGAGYVFSASQPPFTAAAAQAALAVVSKGSKTRSNLVANTKRLQAGLKSIGGLAVTGFDKSPMIFVRISRSVDPEQGAASEVLLQKITDVALQHGVLSTRTIFRPKWTLARSAKPPPPPPPAIRLVVSGAHEAAHMDKAIAAFTKAAAEVLPSGWEAASKASNQRQDKSAITSPIASRVKRRHTPGEKQL